MKHILAPILLLVFLFPSLSFGETIDDLVKRGGIYYKKFTEVPFSGKVTGVEQGSIKNGKREGPWVLYYPNGQLNYKGTYKNGELEGPWVAYFSGGQLMWKTTYRNGKRDGLWVVYWYNGQLNAKGDYKNGLREGPWEYYYENGTVDEKYTGTYKNDEKVD